MEGAQSLELTFQSEGQTRAFAAALATSLGPGDTILLTGQIGAGKSVFSRALIQALMAEIGTVEDVPSPTYTLVQTYQIGDLSVVHADLYRLNDPAEVLDLGLEEAFSEALCLVEWADRLGPLAPASALGISLCDAGKGRRQAFFRFSAPCWRARIEAAIG